MIHTKDEFARIWKKNASDLSHLDFFSYLLINKLEAQLVDDYFKHIKHNPELYPDRGLLSELVVQMVDGLQFLFEQICFGNGCALGCPNKLDKPFSEMEEVTRLEIIEQEFQGDAGACGSRVDCFRHDLMNYTVKDTLLDFYSYYTNIKFQEDDPQILKLASFIVDAIINFTLQNGPVLLKEPFKKTDQFKN